MWVRGVDSSQQLYLPRCCYMSAKPPVGWAANFWQKNFQQNTGVTKNHFAWGGKLDKTFIRNHRVKRYTEQRVQTGDSENLEPSVNSIPMGINNSVYWLGDTCNRHGDFQCAHVNV